jgi:OOP family OmpA-OmpF porin
MFPWSDTSDTFKRPILFDYNQAVIKPESDIIIEEVADAMLSAPRLKLEVQGHTDNIGGVEFNMDLSMRRAQAVMDALIKLGVEERRLRARGFGFSIPIVPNDTEENRARNRRTEFKILAK